MVYGSNFKVSYTNEMCYHFCNNINLSIRKLVWNLSLSAQGSVAVAIATESYTITS